MSYTNDDLKIMQAWPLERKIRVTQTRIMEWYQHYEGKVYVSFSGGKDSTVLLDLARRIYPDIEAVFIDTGLEYPEIKSFVRTFENVTTIKPEMKFQDVIEKYGYPVIGKSVANCIRGAKKGWKQRISRLDGTYKNKDGGKSVYCIDKYKYLMNAPFEVSEECCDVMKKKPANDYFKKTGKYPILGLMANESQLRKKNWLKSGCNAFDNDHPKSSPISFWTEQDVLHYLKDLNIPYCDVYGDIIAKDQFDGQITISEKVDILETTGCNRTGCMFCMFGVHLEKHPNRFEQMKTTHPKQYEYCMRPVDEKGLGLADVLDFIGVEH